MIREFRQNILLLHFTEFVSTKKVQGLIDNKERTEQEQFFD